MSRKDFAKYCQDRQFYLFYRKGTDGRVLGGAEPGCYDYSFWKAKEGQRGFFYAAGFPMMLGHFQLAAFLVTTASLTFWDSL